MAIRHVTDGDFKDKVINADQPVLVDFWADWCGPCRMVAPVVEEVAETTEGRMDVAKLDVDANPQTAAEYGIMSIPTLIMFKNGEIVEKLVGFLPKDSMIQVLEKHLDN